MAERRERVLDRSGEEFFEAACRHQGAFVLDQQAAVDEEPFSAA